MQLTSSVTKCALILLAATPCLAAEIVSFGEVIDVCKINLNTDKVRMFWQARDGSIYGNFANLSAALHQQKEKLVCASNAGIYDTNLRPLGLYVEAGKVLHKLNTRKNAYGNFYLQPNGVFVLSDHDASILSTDEFTDVTIRYATQSGPMLLQNGKVNPIFTPGSDSRVVRNAVCVVSPKEIALAKSRDPINFYDFALSLKDLLKCRDALYLDGSISQLYPFNDYVFGPSFAAMIAVTAVEGP